MLDACQRWRTQHRNRWCTWTQTTMVSSSKENEEGEIWESDDTCSSLRDTLYKTFAKKTTKSIRGRKDAASPKPHTWWSRIMFVLFSSLRDWLIKLSLTLGDYRWGEGWIWPRSLANLTPLNHLSDFVAIFKHVGCTKDHEDVTEDFAPWRSSLDDLIGAGLRCLSLPYKAHLKVTKMSVRTSSV